MNNNNKVTQFIGPWINGQRTTVQFFPDIRQVWIIVRDNTGYQLAANRLDVPADMWNFTVDCYRNHPSFTEHSC